MLILDYFFGDRCFRRLPAGVHVRGERGRVDRRRDPPSAGRDPGQGEPGEAADQPPAGLSPEVDQPTNFGRRRC